MISDLMDRSRRMRRLILLVAAFGCTCAMTSGTLAALNSSVGPNAQATPGRLA